MTNVGNDRSQLAGVAKQTKDALETERLDVVADRGYFNSAEILACEKASITVILPKPMTSNAKAEAAGSIGNLLGAARSAVAAMVSRACRAHLRSRRMRRFSATSRNSSASWLNDAATPQQVDSYAFQAQTAV